MTEQVYLNIKDVMQRYRVSRATVYRWVEIGFLPPGVKLGYSRRWPIDELREFEKENMKKQGGQFLHMTR